MPVPALRGQQDVRQAAHPDPRLQVREVSRAAPAGAARPGPCRSHSAISDCALQVCVRCCGIIRTWSTLNNGWIDVMHRGEQTRQCGPGDIVTISGMFLTVSYASNI